MSQKLPYYAGIVYCFLIPFDQKIVTIAIGLWLVVALMSIKKDCLNLSTGLIVLAICYFTYGLGAIWFNSISLGFFETKFSFLAFAMIFCFTKYDHIERSNLFKSFIYGLFIASLVCLTNACVNSLGLYEGKIVFSPNVLGDKGRIESILYGGNYFFGNCLSIFHQTVYFALYLSTGIAILLFKGKLFKSRTRVLLATFFAAILFLLSNKAGILCLGLILFMWIVSLPISNLKRVLHGFVALLLFVGVIFINPRSRSSVNKLIDGKVAIEKSARYGYATRILSWNAAIALIKESPFKGYGFGNEQKALNKKYSREKYTFPLKKSLNAHNQWLQTWIENGLIAFLAVIVVIIMAFKKAMEISTSQKLYFTLIAILFFNMFFESIFNRFSGISFFSFLVCFIFSSSE